MLFLAFGSQASSREDS